MNEDKTPRAKNLMYAQQLQHLPKGIETAEDLASLIENKLNPVRYAVIIHDQETDDQGQPKEPDIHAMMSFENARYCSSIAKKLGDKPQYVQAWSGEANNGYAYLVHETAKARKEETAAQKKAEKEAQEKLIKAIKTSGKTAEEILALLEQ